MQIKCFYTYLLGLLFHATLRFCWCCCRLDWFDSIWLNSRILIIRPAAPFSALGTEKKQNQSPEQQREKTNQARNLVQNLKAFSKVNSPRDTLEKVIMHGIVGQVGGLGWLEWVWMDGFSKCRVLAMVHWVSELVLLMTDRRPCWRLHIKLGNLITHLFLRIMLQVLIN